MASHERQPEVFVRRAGAWASPGGVVIEQLRPYVLRYAEPGRSTTVGYEFLVGVTASIVVYVSAVHAWQDPPGPATEEDRLRIGRNVLAAFGTEAVLG